MSDFLAAAAQALNAPEVLVKRSAEARSKATGTPVDDILAAWAGGQTVAAPPPSTPAAAPEPAPAAAPAPAPEPAHTAEPEPPPAVVPSGGPAVVTPPPAPTEVTPEEALDVPVVVSVPTAGLTERTTSSIPRWLVATFLLLPLFGLLVLAGRGTAEAGCEEAGFTLAVDRVSGEVENCDGSAFAGKSTGGGGAAAFLAQGQEIYTQCAACHGANGGGGVGPSFAQVLIDFTSCTDHMEWVRLGTNGFRELGRTTYGDLAKPVGGGGVMPSFSQLTDEQLASVVSFERIRFGGGNPDAVLADCGLVTPEGEAPEGEAPAGETPAGETPAGETP